MINNISYIVFILNKACYYIR